MRYKSPNDYNRVQRPYRTHDIGYQIIKALWSDSVALTTISLVTLVGLTAISHQQDKKMVRFLSFFFFTILLSLLIFSLESYNKKGLWPLVLLYHLKSTTTSTIQMHIHYQATQVCKFISNTLYCFLQLFYQSNSKSITF